MRSLVPFEQFLDPMKKNPDLIFFIFFLPTNSKRKQRELLLFSCQAPPNNADLDTMDTGNIPCQYFLFDLNTFFLSELDGTKIGSSHPSLINARMYEHERTKVC